MKTEPISFSRRERNLNTPEDLTKMILFSLLVHATLFGVGVWVSQRMSEPKIYIPVYSVNLVSLPETEKEISKKPPVEPPQKKETQKKTVSIPKKIADLKEKKVAELKKTKASPTPTPVPAKKEEPTPAPAATAETRSPAGPGGQPAVSSSRSAVTIDTLRFPYLWYLKNIQKIVNDNWSTIGLSGIQEPVTVFFRIMRDGSVRDIQIEKSSGNPNLDNSAVQAVVLSSPFEPLPNSYSGTDLGIHYSFTFSGN